IPTLRRRKPAKRAIFGPSMPFRGRPRIARTRPAELRHGHERADAMSDVDLGSRFLRWERRDAVAWVTIDRPERRNALTANMYFGIRRAVDRLNYSPDLHALVITGTGDVFA